jgi:D-alanine--poly(phosphoribitol) ligase subunit 1
LKINLIEYLNETIGKFPNHIAIDDNHEIVLFSELEEFSNKIAQYIISKHTISRQPIAVFLPKSRWSVLSFLGIVKTGNFYVPLDVKSPVERISKILNSLNPEIIITDLAHKNHLEIIGYTNKIILIEEAISKRLTTENAVDLQTIAQQILDLDPIYAIYTSGSTGTPKGVLISHKGVIDFIEWFKTTYSINETTIMGNQVPFYFDVSTLDIYAMVIAGSTLNIIPEDRFAFPIKLLEYVNEKKINTVCWVPSVLNNISNFDAFSYTQPLSLQKILFAGEAMPNKHLNYWRKNYPNALYANLYGPTEITVICTYYNVDRDFNDDESLPIGKACKNIQTLIISEAGKLVKNGEIGELFVRGTSLALGYYNDPEKTNLAFIQNPLHNLYSDLVYKTGDLVYENQYNEIMFMGRKDTQIKHMGYRIELGEIETAILGINGVQNACVLYDDLKNQITAFYISKKLSTEIRKDLIAILPKYMIPRKWIKKDEFALNANGKINRLELKDQI